MALTASCWNFSLLPYVAWDTHHIYIYFSFFSAFISPESPEKLNEINNSHIYIFTYFPTNEDVSNVDYGNNLTFLFFELLFIQLALPGCVRVLTAVSTGRKFAYSNQGAIDTGASANVNTTAVGIKHFNGENTCICEKSVVRPCLLLTGPCK